MPRLLRAVPPLKPDDQPTLCDGVIDIRERWFENVWKAYPRKVNKFQAWRTFLKVCADRDEAVAIHAEILAQVKKGVFSEDHKMVPHLSTWLNRRQWLPKWRDEE